MSDVRTLLTRCRALGAELTPTPRGTLKVSAPAPLPEELRAELKQRKAELLAVLRCERHFLSGPLSHETNPDPWNAWEPFMGWLLEHHPEHYYAVCEAEDAINALERSGTIEGPEYAAACGTLRQRFETARQLALKERVQVWMQ